MCSVNWSSVINLDLFWKQSFVITENNVFSKILYIFNHSVVFKNTFLLIETKVFVVNWLQWHCHLKYIFSDAFNNQWKHKKWDVLSLVLYSTNFLKSMAKLWSSKLWTRCLCVGHILSLFIEIDVNFKSSKCFRTRICTKKRKNADFQFSLNIMIFTIMTQHNYTQHNCKIQHKRY